MYYFRVESEIQYRYATTLATTRIRNTAPIAQEVFFTAVLPETAFISGFTMWVNINHTSCRSKLIKLVYNTKVNNGL